MTHSSEKKTLDTLGSDDTTIPMPSRKWLLRFGFPVALIVVAVVLLAITGWQALRPATNVTSSTVAVRAIETDEPLPATGGGIVQAPGWVEPDPFSTYVSALTQGVVKDVLVLEGDKIKQGQVVATLIDEDAQIALRRAKSIVAQRTGELAAANAALEAAKTERTELVEVTRRTEVAKSKKLELEAQLEGFPARIVQSEALRDQIKDEYERKKNLTEDGAVAKGPVLRLGLKLRSAEAAINMIKAEQKTVEAKLATADAELEAAKRSQQLLVHETLEVEHAKAQVAVAKGALARAEADRDEAKLAFERTQITSPSNGVVIERLTSPGSTIQFENGTHGAHVIHIYDPANLQVRADIPLAEAAKVGVGQQAEIVVDLLPDTIFKGEVTRFIHRADISKNTVEAKVRIFDPSPLLKPDMLARVRILPGSTADGKTAMRTVERIFVPNASIDKDGATWVIEGSSRDRGTVHRTVLELGDREIEGWREVLSGLQPGDSVVVDDQPLYEGQVVRMKGEESS